MLPWFNVMLSGGQRYGDEKLSSFVLISLFSLFPLLFFFFFFLNRNSLKHGVKNKAKALFLSLNFEKFVFTHKFRP
jgi:hypothetical protein